MKGREEGKEGGMEVGDGGLRRRLVGRRMSMYETLVWISDSGKLHTCKDFGMLQELVTLPFWKLQL